MMTAPRLSGLTMRRREFLGLAIGATLPRAAWAQQPRDGVRRLGVLTVTAPNDSVSKGRAAVLKQSLAALDWKEGTNLRIDWRDGDGDMGLIERSADELIASVPDVLLAVGTPCVAAANEYDSHRVWRCHRSDRPGICRQPLAPRRQCHRIYRL
jgi:hypothetical protein